MVTSSKERLKKLEHYRKLWEQADEAPGEQAEGLAKGEIYKRILSLTEEKTSRPRLKKHKTFSPIDGSYFMMRQNKAGAVMERSRR